MDKILVGMVTKPQALKGAFRIKPNILNIKQFKKMKELLIDNIIYKVEQIILRDTFVIAKVEGIDSCEEAENLRNKQVFGEAIIDKSDSFDLKNFDCVVGDKKGKIVDINNFGSKDILTIKFEKECMIPVIDGLLENIDEANKIVTINEKLFEEVAIYED